MFHLQAATALRARVLGCALLFALGQACGSQATAGAPGAFTPQHAALFDDGVDLIENPDGLQGLWRSEWEADVDARLNEADWVASGKVTTIHVEVDPEGRATHHVLFEVGREHKGDAPRGEVTLASRQGAPGYASLEQHRSHLLDRGFVAFVRYAEEDGARVAHFHLMPPSGAVLRAIERYGTAKSPSRIQVIEHQQR